MKLIVGDFKIEVKVEEKGDRLWLNFPFSRPLMAEIKVMDGAKWHGYDEPVPIKQWSIYNNKRNQFQLARLRGENPYKKWQQPPLPILPKRSVYDHQRELFQVWMTTHYAIWAAEMGTGKTLAAIEGIEYVQPPSCWWIGPKSALAAVKLEFRKWNAQVIPEFYTYENLVRILKDWTPGMRPPMMVIFDESSRCKTPSSQRSQACQYLADAVRETWGDEGYVLLMSGSPAPKSPADWWKQCEIACPGWLREGNIFKFNERYAILRAEDSTTGGKYNRLIGWRDSEDRCQMCGEFKDFLDHTLTEEMLAINPLAHQFVPSTNEVAALYRRMKGLVTVKLKKDCLNLPDKIFKRIKCKPTPQTLNAAKLLLKSAPSAAVALIWARELSDGFQYEDTQIKVPHVACGGKGCELCTDGLRNAVDRKTIQVPCPKEDAFIDILDQHEDIGRLVAYAGFTGSIDRLVDICRRFQWQYIRVDGRGWDFTSTPGVTSPEEALMRFQDPRNEDKIVFIGHPGSAGMGLTLTASPTIVYYSNDFNAESRIQSMDRIHRPGMDVNRGATIIDLIHLPTDLKILANLEAKMDLQSMTMGELQEAMDYAEVET